MEKYQPPHVRTEHQPYSSREDVRVRDDDLLDEVARAESRARAEEIINTYRKNYRRKASTRKWAGGILSGLGMATFLTACPFYSLTLIGPETVLAGLGLTVAGGLLFFIRPQTSPTNRALMIAMKYGNALTVPRLALEMDVSFDKAEKVLRQLVKSGMAEIDLDHKDPDGSIVYKVKGL